MGMGRLEVRAVADDQTRSLEDLRAVWLAVALGIRLSANISFRPKRAIRSESYSLPDVSLFSHVVQLILPPLLPVFGAPVSSDSG
jgi:hypothetical protein